MHTLLIIVVTAVITLAAAILALAMFSETRPVASEADESSQIYGPFELGSPRNDDGKRAENEELIDTDTRAAMAEVMAIYGVQQSAIDNSHTDKHEIDDAPLVRLTNTILQQAIKEHASEIYLEPDRRGMRVRFRIDGVLHEVMQMPSYLNRPVSARLRVLAQVDLLELLIPQSGMIWTKYNDSRYNLLVNFVPEQYGVSTSIRVFDQSRVQGKLSTLGLLPAVQESLLGISARSTGLLVLTGPRDSGRNTMAYNLLARLNKNESKIVTVEERAGYQIDGLTQVYLDQSNGRTLTAAMKGVLQHNPDVLFIGVEDSVEAMTMALQAAQNCFVIATMSAPDTHSALIRLKGMGIDPDMIAYNLAGILAQRLVRRICTNCKETYEANANDLRTFGFRANAPQMMIKLARGRGCDLCRNQGYRGRMGVHSLLTMDTELADGIANEISPAQLREFLRHNRTGGLHEDGLVKVLEGFTTPEEVQRVLAPAKF